MKKNLKSMRRLLITIISLLPVFIFSGCKNDLKPQKAELIGEWKYVGTFDHRANYACYICPEFNYDTAIYSITFDGEGALNTAINLMRGKANYTLKTLESNLDSKSWEFQIMDYVELNKPPETAEDGIFRNKLLNGFLIGYLANESSKYRSIQIQFSENEFLYFVQKK